MLRIDFNAAAAERLGDVDTLSRVLAWAFRHRRKQLGSLLRDRSFPFAPEAFAAALAEAGIPTTDRAERVAPQAFRVLANALAGPCCRPEGT